MNEFLNSSGERLVLFLNNLLNGVAIEILQQQVAKSLIIVVEMEEVTGKIQHGIFIAYKADLRAEHGISDGIFRQLFQLS